MADPRPMTPSDVARAHARALANEHVRDTRFPKLFSPVSLGARLSKNRIMRVATTSNLAEQGRVGARMLAFYRTVAEGGAGVLVSEAMRLHPLEGVVPHALRSLTRASYPACGGSATQFTSRAHFSSCS